MPTAFDAFHWLPEENPANIVEISSDDDDAVHQPALPYPHHAEKTPKVTEPSAEAKAASAAFRKAISTSVPIYFADHTARQKVRGAGIRMLEIGLSSGREWDPEVQSLHQVIQSRLMECQDAQELGSSLRGVIVQLGNERLREAIRLGLELEDVTIGHDLLPTWQGRDGHDVVDDDATVMGADSSGNSNNAGADSVADSVAEESIGAATVLEHQPPSAWSSDTESEEEPETESMSDYDDEISLFNFVNQYPIVEEADANAPLSNIVHGVDIFGLSHDGCPVDFGVYLAQGDDMDIEQLPEVELAIDEDAFAQHYHLADAIDIELVDGAEIYWVAPSRDDEADQDVDAMEVPEYTMESAEEGEDEAPNEPVTPPSAAEVEVQTDWIVL